MIAREWLRSIRNDLPMKLAIVRLGRHGHVSKQSDGYFRFQCSNCNELRATVNPRIQDLSDFIGHPGLASTAHESSEKWSAIPTQEQRSN